MTSLAEIEAAIQGLSGVEVRQLAEWLQDYIENTWDHQIEEDTKKGRLDQLIARAETDILNQQVKPLDEVLHNL